MSQPSSRVEAIDLLRGLVMVVMALDHVRDFVMPLADPTNLATTYPALFFTRFITHYCAPTFYFLAGVGAFYAAKRRTPNELSWFLITRGLWLVFLEMVIVRFGWYFSWNNTNFEGLTIWALGWSMVALAGFVRMPAWLMISISAAMVLGHNALDGVKPEAFGPLAWLWKVLHAPAPIVMGSVTLQTPYTLVPWMGVMALGFAFGQDGIKRALKLGPAFIVAFVVLRFSNLYGDPHPWSIQTSLSLTVMSFLSCEKYPPSLLYLLMTLGPSITLLGLVDWWAKGGTRQLPALAKPVILFGRVPMFYYLLHLYLAHLLGICVALYRFGDASSFFIMPAALMGNPKIPSDAPLWVVYAVWAVVLVALYPACQWFAAYKSRNRDKEWLSYL
jgi:uncharacterized membrane protein